MMDWLGPGELRVGLGCMRLSTDEERDDRRALETIAAAAEAGISVFDTAHSYGRGENELGHNERLVVRALRETGSGDRARIVTKGGMRRSGTAWVPDGRARSIRADCEASLAVLDGQPVDLYLLHAPDPRTPWRTSVRALARLVDDGLVPRIGVCNVNRAQLVEALEHAAITAVQVALSTFDDGALRGGILDRCVDAGITLMAHSPLGGPRRARGLSRRETLAAVARERGVPEAEVALAWVLDLAPNVVVVPGARRAETARSAAHAASLQLDDGERAQLGRTRARRVVRKAGDVVLVMGVPGAGKSRLAAELVARGYRRLNRDERGGSLRDLAEALEEALADGTRQVVLDNTYLTRASRSYVLETAARHGISTRCVWLDTPLAQAQINLVERLLDRFGKLLTPEELNAAARSEPGVLSPTRQMRSFRELEAPADDEGFAVVERVPFERGPAKDASGSGVLVAAAAVGARGWEEALAGVDPKAPHLVFDWRPDRASADLASAVTAVADVVSGTVEAAICPHSGGAPICWCRVPLPGLPLVFARRHGIDLTRSALLGTSAAHRTLATALGARHLSLDRTDA